MAAFEELMYQALTSDSQLAGMLASFDGKPAVFDYHAPPDTDPGWNGSQYPRVDYAVLRREDPERRVAGVLQINVWQENTGEAAIEAVEARIRAILDGAMFHPDDEPVMGVRWARSELFTAGREQTGISTSELAPTDLLLGMLAEFDLMAFPAQTTYSPDPIASLTAWSKTAFAGLQTDLATWLPTSGEPALYWRLEGTQMAELQAAVTWYDATIYGHILAPMPQDRLVWVRRVCEQLFTDRILTLDDGSPMYVQRLSSDTKQDPLRVGQIRLIARYGVLSPELAGQVLQHTYLNGQEV